MRIIAIISLPPAGKTSSMMNGLRLAMADGKHCLHLHVPTRIFPSSWGSITKNYSPKDSARIETDQNLDQLKPEEVEELRAWIDQGHINLLPAGFAGSLHAVLNIEEIKAETEWAIANPWRSGIKDNFGQSPDLILPFWPDPHRPHLLRETASRFSLGALGVLSAEKSLPGSSESHGGKHSGHYLVFGSRDHADELKALAWLRIKGDSNSRQIQQQIENRLAEDRTGDLMVQFEPKADCSDIDGFLQALAGLGHLCTPHINPQNLDEIGIAHRREEILSGQLLPISDPTASMNPDFRWQISRLPEGRRARSATQERLRTQLLSSIPGIVPSRIGIQAEPPLKSRSLLAMMQGSATIMADDFEARFTEGKFTGFYHPTLHDENSPGIRFVPSIGMCLRSEDRTMSVETESAVSFETDYSRGLRETLVLRNEQTRIPGRIIADFMIADRSRHILLDMQIRYPWFAKTVILEEVRPVVLSIALPESTRESGVSIVWKRQDGSECITRLGYPSEVKTHGGNHPLFNLNLVKQLRALPEMMRQFGRKRPAMDHINWQEIPSTTLFGSSWTISWNEDGHTRGLQLCRLPDESAQSAPFELRLRPDMNSKDMVLEIFPEGRYRQISSDDLRSLNHHFVLGMFPFFDGESVPPAMDEMINHEVPPFFMVRES